MPPQDKVRVGAWAEVRELLELQLAPLGRRGLAALAPHPGKSALDIGCGGGETALELVRAVAPDGTVVGIDLSAAVLAFAQRAAQGYERVRFIQADAEVFPFEPASSILLKIPKIEWLQKSSIYDGMTELEESEPDQWPRS